MILMFRPIKAWPPDWAAGDTNRPSSPFTANYSDTLHLLDRELRELGATNIVLQVDATDRDCRLDGQLRADAKVKHPGVILTFDTRNHGTLTYACDRYEKPYWRNSSASWQHNLRAIALGLEALRKVERYGIAERGQQYAGYRELGSGIPLGSHVMTVEEAAAFIAAHVDDPSGRAVDVADDPFFALALFRDAAKRLHPDAGGDPALFRRLTEAREILEAAGG